MSHDPLAQKFNEGYDAGFKQGSFLAKGALDLLDAASLALGVWGRSLPPSEEERALALNRLVFAITKAKGA